MSGIIPLGPGEDTAELARAVDAMKAQLLIVLVNRLGGSIEIPVSEIDATGSWILEMALDRGSRTFTFNAVRKS